MSSKGRNKLARMFAEGGERALHGVYSVIFAAVDREWVESGATYMEFSQVVKKVRGLVLPALASKNVKTYDDFAVCLRARI